MPERTECIADDGQLHVVKLHRFRHRQLTVDVFAPGGRRVQSANLSADVDRAVIDGLDQELTYDLRQLDGSLLPGLARCFLTQVEPITVRSGRVRGASPFLHRLAPCSG